ILTGSDSHGRALLGTAANTTCNNWTSDSTGSAMVGHHDRSGGGNSSWNAAHMSRSCSQSDLVATGGAGLFYCFGVWLQIGNREQKPSTGMTAIPRCARNDNRGSVPGSRGRASGAPPPGSLRPPSPQGRYLSALTSALAGGSSSLSALM